MAGELVYLDASAFVKLVVEEPESAAMERAAEAWRWTSSALLEVEVVVAVRRRDRRRLEGARALLTTGELVEIGAAVRRSAGELDGLRSLDAIHLATAISLGDHVGAFFTYDDRLAAAARAHGLTVTVPQP